MMRKIISPNVIWLSHILDYDIYFSCVSIGVSTGNRIPPSSSFLDVDRIHHCMHIVEKICCQVYVCTNLFIMIRKIQRDNPIKMFNTLATWTCLENERFNSHSASLTYFRYSLFKKLLARFVKLNSLL